MGKPCFNRKCWNQHKTKNECWQYWNVEKCSDWKPEEAKGDKP